MKKKLTRKEKAEKEERDLRRDFERRQKREEEREKREAERIRIRREQSQMELKIIEVGYKNLAKRLHPDVGGTDEEMHELQKAKLFLINCIERGR